MAAWILFPAQPAPTILATTAGHVITSRDFLDSCFTLRAISDISIIRCPSIELSIYICVTLSTVPSLTTLETYFMAAFTINTVAFSFYHKPVAIRCCAPFEISICININVFLELKVLLKDLLRTELSYIFSCILSTAACVRTFNSYNFPIGDIESYIVSHTIQAE